MHMTFSAPKSVSVLWVVSNEHGRRMIEQACALRHGGDKARFQIMALPRLTMSVCRRLFGVSNDFIELVGGFDRGCAGEARIEDDFGTRRTHRRCRQWGRALRS